MSKTITQILSIVVEDFKNFTLPELKEMKATLEKSSNPKKNLKLDVISATIKNKMKELKALGEQGELELVENSKKVIPSSRKRQTEKGKTKVSPAKPIHKEDEEAEKEKQKKKNVQTKAKQKEAEQEQEDEEEEEEEEAGAKVLYAETVKYTPFEELENVEDLPKYLVENPYKIFALINEGEGVNTMFLVLFANEERVTFLDGTDNSVLQLATKGVKPSEGIVTYNRKKFKTQFYIQSPLAKGEGKGA